MGVSAPQRLVFIIMQTITNKRLNGLIFTFVLGASIFMLGCSGRSCVRCAPDYTTTINENRVKKIAKDALKKWIEYNPVDSAQIKGAKVVKIECDDIIIHVTLMKDNSTNNQEGIHKAYFHVYLLSENLEVIKVVRGPDEIS